MSEGVAVLAAGGEVAVGKRARPRARGHEPLRLAAAKDAHEFYQVIMFVFRMLYFSQMG